MSEGGAGRSSVHMEPPDIFVWTLFGDVDVDQMRELADLQERLSKGMPIFVLLDVTNLASVSADARKEGVRKRDVNVLGTAYVGASVHIRVIATLVDKAASVLYRKKVAPARFFSSKAEALAWFAERRGELSKDSI